MRERDKVLSSLAQSDFRQRFRLADRDQRYLEEKGLETVLEHARRFIDQRLAPGSPARDGKQTPYRGHPVFVAQHATATCCRACLQQWHGIARGRPLSPAEREHVLAVLERWLRSQAMREPQPAPR
jgi:predicted Fe-S protein YdhL (DUF1289 family)